MTKKVGRKKGCVTWNKGLKTGIRTAGAWGKNHIPWNKGLKWSDEVKKKIAVKHYKGENVGYKGLHMWLRKDFGNPNRCSMCGKTGSIQWANISGEYRRDINDWKQLCSECHGKFDRGRKGYAVKKYGRAKV
jgi:hypothetical protein